MIDKPSKRNFCFFGLHWTIFQICLETAPPCWDSSFVILSYLYTSSMFLGPNTLYRHLSPRCHTQPHSCCTYSHTLLICYCDKKMVSSLRTSWLTFPKLFMTPQTVLDTVQLTLCILSVSLEFFLLYLFLLFPAYCFQ